jgi:ribosomal protein L37AE/L43A
MATKGPGENTKTGRETPVVHTVMRRRDCKKCNGKTMHSLNNSGDWCCLACGEITMFLGLDNEEVS